MEVSGCGLSDLNLAHKSLEASFSRLYSRTRRCSINTTVARWQIKAFLQIRLQTRSSLKMGKTVSK